MIVFGPIKFHYLIYCCAHTHMLHILSVCVSLIKLNNYVVQLITSTSDEARFGSQKIFLLLNDSSNDSHFSTRQNMKPEVF